MTLIDEKIIDGKRYIKMAGVSDDTPPTGDDIATGSEFFEIDTGSTQYYDAATSSWAAPSSGDQTPADAS